MGGWAGRRPACSLHAAPPSLSQPSFDLIHKHDSQDLCPSGCVTRVWPCSSPSGGRKRSQQEKGAGSRWAACSEGRPRASTVPTARSCPGGRRGPGSGPAELLYIEEGSGDPGGGDFCFRRCRVPGTPSWDGAVWGLGFTPPPQVPMRVSTCVDARNVPDQPQDSASVTVPSVFWGVPGCRVGLTHTGWWWWAMLSPRPGTRGR